MVSELATAPQILLILEVIDANSKLKEVLVPVVDDDEEVEDFIEDDAGLEDDTLTAIGLSSGEAGDIDADSKDRLEEALELFYIPLDECEEDEEDACESSSDSAEDEDTDGPLEYDGGSDPEPASSSEDEDEDSY